MTPSPIATRRASSFRSVPDMWDYRVGSTPGLAAMSHRVHGRWQSLTWRDADARMRAMAHGLLAFGLQRGERCAILASTSVDWVLSDIAIVSAGGATTTIYPSDTATEAAWILSDASVRLLFCDTDDQVAKARTHADTLPGLTRIVVFDGTPTDDGFVQTVEDFVAAGRAHAEAHPDALEAVKAGIAPEDVATVIYTSGTTDRPKGVVLTHDAWVYEAEAIDQLGVVGPDDKQFLFLPLAHVFAKVMQVAFIRLGVHTAIDGSIDRFLDNVGEVRPTWMAAVPRVFEKAYNRIVDQARSQGRASWLTFQWAVSVGREVSRRRQAGHRIPPQLRIQQRLADRLVFRTIKERFGGRLRFLVSGGAPLPVEIATFFDACGILICEGYGLTESSAASCVNTPGDVVFGTVGRPLPGCEVKVAPDGELLLRSRGVMTGYLGQPEATAEALDADGWLHTGDIGRVLPTGHVQITDRKKELIVTAGGKNVAPGPLQRRIETRSPYIAHALVHGDRRNFLTALIDIDTESVGRWATAEGIRWHDHAELATHPDVRTLVQQIIDDVNREVAGYEQVRKFAITPEPFSISNGMLTPSMKIKRRVVESRYRTLLDSFYDGAVVRLP